MLTNTKYTIDFKRRSKFLIGQSHSVTLLYNSNNVRGRIKFGK